MDNIIKESLRKAQSYADYKMMILDLLKEGKSTGLEQNDNLYNF